MTTPMTAALLAGRQRAFALLGRASMYRLVMVCLAILAGIALGVSFLGLVVPTPGELVASAAVLAAACVAVDALAQRVLRMPWRVESSLITALILLFVVRPSLEPLGLVGIAVAGAAASASKYLIAWRGRHILNPAAVGATLVTVVGLGSSAWWVGSPYLALPVIALGAVVVARMEKARMVLLFLAIAIAVALVRTFVQYSAAGIAVDALTVVEQVVLSSPFLFLGAFMLTEPLTQPPRRWQQLTVAAIVGVLAGWPIDLGVVSLGQERALLIGNLVAFAFAFRAAVRLTLHGRAELTPTVRELSFRASRPVAFRPGQYVELEVPHRRPDARGTRREFSITSAPAELPELRIAFREVPGAPVSSYKKALAEVATGGRLGATGVWGDFVLPARADVPLLLVAAGIGVTPFVAQLRDAQLAGEPRDVVLVYVASSADELAFRDRLGETGIRVVVVTPDEPADLPAHWEWAGGARLDGDLLARLVPDLGARSAFVSGPPRLIAALAPALARAKSVTTDAFAGY